MKIDVLLGLQWGDEGKGKIVDVLTPNYNIITRFQGGANAGHTLEIGGDKHILHLIPSGIFHSDTVNVIGNGVIIDPYILNKEIDNLRLKKVNAFQNLLVSKKAHLILPTHRLLDAVYERAKGKLKIGSTLKGIGPTYTDKVGRNGIRLGNITDSKFIDKYNLLKEKHLRILESYKWDEKDFLIEGLSFSDYEKSWFAAVEKLKSLKLIDSEYFIDQSLVDQKRILAEGAQGTLLDVDFGSYPFVTSSSTTCSGVCSGLGVAPNRIGAVYGIVKAYCTRVGSGPFPTELFDTTGERLRDNGKEFGSTTGRPRRCGWLDLVALKYAIMLNGVSSLVMTKADVLSGFDTIKVCTHYKVNGEIINYLPFEIMNEEIEPVYHELKGWGADISNLTSLNELPQEFNDYMRFIENFVGVPFDIVSIGPGRKQTLMINKNL